uniref:Uncharacterized protein n=1 Tax=Cacopsylla melanoneura TaxID=428564 RepID=A0A8D9FBJ3_9HEMI
MYVSSLLSSKYIEYFLLGFRNSLMKVFISASYFSGVILNVNRFLSNIFLILVFFDELLVRTTIWFLKMLRGDLLFICIPIIGSSWFECTVPSCVSVLITSTCCSS